MALIDRLGSAMGITPYEGPSPTNWWESSDIQRYLPQPLRYTTGKGRNLQFTPLAHGLWEGTANIAELLRHPGSFTGNLAEAIAPRVAMESEAINRNTRGSMAEAAGASARAGTGSTGIAQAVQRALEAAGSKEKAQSLRTAQYEGAQLQRADLDRLFQIYNLILQFSEQARRENRKQRKEHIEQRNRQVAGWSSLISSVASAFS